jgi:hypothetical protein
MEGNKTAGPRIGSIKNEKLGEEHWFLTMNGNR